MSDINKTRMRGLHGFFNPIEAAGVNCLAKGVAVTNAQGQLIHWVNEKDEEKAGAVADALTDAILDGTPVDWEALGYK